MEYKIILKKIYSIKTDISFEEFSSQIQSIRDEIGKNYDKFNNFEKKHLFKELYEKSISYEKARGVNRRLI